MKINCETIIAIATSITAIPIIIRFAKKLPEHWRSRNLISIQKGSFLMKDIKEKFQEERKDPLEFMFSDRDAPPFLLSDHFPHILRENMFECVKFCLKYKIDMYGKLPKEVKYHKISPSSVPYKDCQSNFKFNGEYSKIYKFSTTQLQNSRHENDALIVKHIKIDKKQFKKAIEQFKPQPYEEQ
jgi:hypothetical protein